MSHKTQKSKSFTFCSQSDSFYGMGKRIARKKGAVNHKAAFTLIELLVVIAVISMLMAILLPSLREAKKQGKRVHCQASLHQLTLAWMSYAEVNNDYICSASMELNCPRPWLNETSPPFSPHNWVSEGEGLAYNPIIGHNKSTLARRLSWSTEDYQ